MTTTYSRRPLFIRGGTTGTSSFWKGRILGPDDIPSTALLTEDGQAILTEDSNFILTES